MYSSLLALLCVGEAFFKLQKKVVRIMSGVEPRDSCRALYKKLNILPLSCEYILSLMMSVIDNQTKFCSGLDVHGLNTRNRKRLYLPHSNLSVFQKGTYYVRCYYTIQQIAPNHLKP
jgi:hypothetical protein